MIQYGLDIPSSVTGFFTLEKRIVGCSLIELEGILGFQRGRLKQGADFYILSTPNNPLDFEIMGTTLFPGHKMKDSKLKKSLNSFGMKKEHIQKFKRNRLIKVAPIEIHVEAMRQFLTPDEYSLVSELSLHGLSEKEFIREIERRFYNHRTLVQQIKDGFQKIEDLYIAKPEMNDIMYPSATGGAIEQWKLLKPIPARCVCRLTDYMEDRYRSVF